MTLASSGRRRDGGPGRQTMIDGIQRELALFRGDVNRRFDSMDRRFDRVDDRMTRQFQWLVGLHLTTLVALVAALSAIAAR